jgi:hypothetical protein
MNYLRRISVAVLATHLADTKLAVPDTGQVATNSWLSLLRLDLSRQMLVQ